MSVYTLNDPEAHQSRDIALGTCMCTCVLFNYRCSELVLRRVLEYYSITDVQYSNSNSLFSTCNHKCTTQLHTFSTRAHTWKQSTCICTSNLQPNAHTRATSIKAARNGASRFPIVLQHFVVAYNFFCTEFDCF